MAQSFYPSYFFKLSFKDEEAAFQEVQGISRELNVEEVVGGGINNFTYKLPKVTKSPNLILKRALVGKSSELANWCAQAMDQSFAKPIETHNVSVILLEITKDNKSNPTERKRWVFNNAYPVKYKISDLKSQENSIVFESIELAYTFYEISKEKTVQGLFV